MRKEVELILINQKDHIVAFESKVAQNGFFLRSLSLYMMDQV